MTIPSSTPSFREQVNAGVFTHRDVPVRLASLLVEQLRAGTCLTADEFVNAHYEQLRGHALDPTRLKFENAGHLRSTLIVANADPGVKWHSFGALAIVTDPRAPEAGVFKRIDFYSVAPRASGAIYLGDVYLRLDVAKNGTVLGVDLGAVEDADESSTINAYGTMLYVAALALSSAKIDVLA